MKLTQNSISVSARCILQVRKTKIELELIKSDFFPGALDNHSSNLIISKIVPCESRYFSFIRQFLLIMAEEMIIQSELQKQG